MSSVMRNEQLFTTLGSPMMSFNFQNLEGEKDGYNWYAYCNNDPINYIDPNGLESADAAYSRAQQEAISSQVKPVYFTQDRWKNDYGRTFSNNACAATSLLNELSEEYTKQTREQLTEEQADKMMKKAVENGSVNTINAHTTWAPAANDMWDETELQGDWTYNQKGNDHRIYSLDTGNARYPTHFVNSASNSDVGYFDVNTGEYGDIRNKKLSDWQYRNVDFSSDLEEKEGSDCE